MNRLIVVHSAAMEQRRVIIIGACIVFTIALGLLFFPGRTVSPGAISKLVSDDKPALHIDDGYAVYLKKDDGTSVRVFSVSKSSSIEEALLSPRAEKIAAIAEQGGRYSILIANSDGRNLQSVLIRHAGISWKNFVWVDENTIRLHLDPGDDYAHFRVDTFDLIGMGTYNFVYDDLNTLIKIERYR